jgi:CubicO group peptidase (beta-lactamase class C family)
MPKDYALVTALTLGIAACGGGATPRPPAPARQSTRTTPPEPRQAGQSFATADPEFTFPDPDRRRKLESAFPAVDVIVQEAVTRGEMPGAAVGIVIDGDLAYAKGFGFSSAARRRNSARSAETAIFSSRRGA